MLRPGTWGDVVFLRLVSLYLETDIIVILAFMMRNDSVFEIFLYILR